MPKIVNEAERKARIAKAVWDISAERGLHAATVRAVAAQCGLSVGAIQHSFNSQTKLQRYAMALLVEQAKSRIEMMAESDIGAIDDNDAIACDPSGSNVRLEKVALLLEQLLPFDEERCQEARVWAMFSSEALFDDGLRAYVIEMNDLMERFCLNCLEHLRECCSARHETDLFEEAMALQALLDGLTLRLLVSPDVKTAATARQALRHHLQRLCVSG